MAEYPTTNSTEKTGCTGIILRYFWMVAGNILLFVMSLFIVQKKSFFSIFDILFWAVVGLLILIRYIDIIYFQGDDADGKPATIDHFRRYALFLLVISMVIWATTNGIAYYY